MLDLTKSERRTVQQLLAEAHEAEIAAALSDVEAAIREWRKGDILPSDVNARIHAFHNKSQEIFKAYNHKDLVFALARAVALGFVANERVPETLRTRMKEIQALLGP